MKKAPKDFEVMREILMNQTVILAAVSILVPAGLRDEVTKRAEQTLKYIEEHDWT